MALSVTRGGILAGLLALTVAAVCVRLGFWQLDRLEQRRARNEAVRTALSLPPLPLPDSLEPLLADPAAYRYRRVRARGVFDPAGEVVLRGRSLEGRPGVNLVTPLRLGGGEAAVLVNRGWAPSPDAFTIDPRPLAEGGARTIEAIVHPVPHAADGMPRTAVVGGTRVLSVQRLDLASLRARSETPLLPVYLQQLPGPGNPELPRRLPLPDPSDQGPHLGYAVQWFSFATIALGGYLLLLFLRFRRPG